MVRYYVRFVNGLSKTKLSHTGVVPRSLELGPTPVSAWSGLVGQRSRTTKLQLKRNSFSRNVATAKAVIEIPFILNSGKLRESPTKAAIIAPATTVSTKPVNMLANNPSTKSSALSGAPSNASPTTTMTKTMTASRSLSILWKSPVGYGAPSPPSLAGLYYTRLVAMCSRCWQMLERRLGFSRCGSSDSGGPSPPYGTVRINTGAARRATCHLGLGQEGHLCGDPSTVSLSGAVVECSGS